MPRPGLRRVAPWVLVVLAGIVVFTGAATVAPHLHRAVGATVRSVAAELPETLALPPTAVDRVTEAVAERPEPLRGSLVLVLTTGAAVLALGVAGRARREGTRAAASQRGGPGATRGPPAVG